MKKTQKKVVIKKQENTDEKCSRRYFNFAKKEWVY